MPSWLEQGIDSGAIFTVALVLFILYLCGMALVKSWTFILKFVRLVHTLVGDEETPGIHVRMEKQSEKLDAIAEHQDRHTVQIATVMHEVLPNHGSSLNDSVRRTEAFQKELSAKLDEHIGMTDVWHPMLDALYKDFNKKEEI